MRRYPLNIALSLSAALIGLWALFLSGLGAAGREASLGHRAYLLDAVYGVTLKMTACRPATTRVSGGDATAGLRG